jgi:inositol-phosphate transport system substrate-binding protein
MVKVSGVLALRTSTMILASLVLMLVVNLASTNKMAEAKEVVIKAWSRADRSGPLRAGNIVSAADTMNKMLKASGADVVIKLEVHENNAKGFDDDALDLMKAFAAGKGPDIFVAAHEWTGAFVEAGYALNLENHIAAHPEFYGDIIPVLWESVTYKGQRYGIPQDSEVRMFFYNKDMLRKIGKSEEFIESLPELVEKGEFTIYELTDLAAEVKTKGAAKYGLIHRPNVGPDFQMAMASFGIDPYNDQTGTLQISKSKLERFYKWLKYAVDKEALPQNITSWSWDTVHQAFRGEEAFMKFHGIWNVPKQLEAMNLDGEEAYFHKLGWLHSPPEEKGGRPANLSHPIIYIVSAKSKYPELSALLVALASQPIPNTKHAVTTGHTPINHSQTALPEFIEKGWALRAGAEMLPYSTFMPSHSKIGQYNALIYKGIQGVETGRISPKEGAEFVVDELQNELGSDVAILE